jgi:hypothetical protein
MPIDRTSSNATSAAFGLAAAVTVLFNTLLVWLKEAVPSVQSVMVSLTGHHWITHGLADVIVFVVLGLVFQRVGMAERLSGTALVVMLALAVVVAGLGLVGWFVIV